VIRVKELGPGDPIEEKAMNVDEQDDSSLAQQNSALAMLRTGNVSVFTQIYYGDSCSNDCCNHFVLAIIL